MNSKVGQQQIPLYSGHRQPGRFQIVKHLREDTQVKGGRAETANTSYRPGTDKQEKENGEQCADQNMLLFPWYGFVISCGSVIPSEESVET